MQDSRIASGASPSTRVKILETAEALFARDGYAGVGMRAVAEAVGIGKSSLFHHFESKLSLYVAVVERSLLAIDARVAAIVSQPDDPLASLRRWIEVVIDTLAADPNCARLLLRTLVEAPIVAAEDAERIDRIIQRMLGHVEASLRAGIALGQLRKTSIPHTIQSLIGMTVYHFASGEFGDELMGQAIFSAAEVRRRKQHVVSFLEGLAVRPA